jgi:hypothetical protein
MLFPRLKSGRRRARGLDWRFIKLMIIVIIIVIAISQLWRAFADRTSASSIAGSAASTPAPK